MWHPIKPWIQENMPQLHERLCLLPTEDHCRVVLNEITGFDFKSCDDKREGMDMYLEKLKELKK
jgi:hypothetical protein